MGKLAEQQQQSSSRAAAEQQSSDDMNRTRGGTMVHRYRSTSLPPLALFSLFLAGPPLSPTSHLEFGGGAVRDHCVTAERRALCVYRDTLRAAKRAGVRAICTVSLVRRARKIETWVSRWAGMDIQGCSVELPASGRPLGAGWPA